MTRKIAISLPDDVADWVAQEENVSAYIADALRRRMDSAHVRVTLRSLGFELSDDSLAHARAELDAARAGVTPELRATAAALRTEAKRGR